MKVLNYGQIIRVAKSGKILLDGVKYIMPEDLKLYVSNHLPISGSFVIGQHAILVAMTDRERGEDSESGAEIVMFLPNGPPDPGII